MATQTEPETIYQIRIDPGVKERLERLSNLMGVPSATLGAFAVGSWVAQQERTLALIESMGDRVGGEIGIQLKQMLRTGLFQRQQNMPDQVKLTRKEIGVIAEHEQLPENSAAGLGSSLLQSQQGISELERFIRENIEIAKLHANVEKAQELERILTHFKQAHTS